MTLVFWFCMIQNLSSQAPYEDKFFNYFNQQNLSGKVYTFDTLSSELKLKCYPLVKDELEKIKEQAKLDNKTLILDRLIKIDGEIYYLNKNYSKAIPIFTDLLAKHKIRNYADSAEILHYLKKAYVHIHSLNKAIEIHKVLERLKEKHPDIDPWLLHPLLSSIYFEMKLYKECLGQQLLEYKDIKNNNPMLLGYFNNRGLFWSKFNNQDSAIACYTEAKKVFNKMYAGKKLNVNDEFVFGLIEGNMGQSYIELKEYVKAIPLLEKDVASSINAKNMLNAAVSEIELAKCYLNLNKPQIGKRYLDSANYRLSNVDDYNSRLSLIRQFAVYYEMTGAYKASIASYNRFIFLKDSIDQQENLKELISSHVAYQMAEKEHLILENQKKINEKNTEVDEEKNIRNFLLFSGLLLIIIIVIIAVQLRRANRQKKLLEFKNKKIKTRNWIISKSLADKDLLIKEIHHRVKNNLQIVSSLLKLQASKTTNKEIQVSLSEAQDRLNSMSTLHQLLYKNNQMTKLSLDDYLTSLIAQIKSSFSSTIKNVKVSINMIALELDIDTAIPLGLITNEIMSNSFKHAFNGKDGEINIVLSKSVNNKYMLRISDNGIGIPANFDLKSIDSLGLDIVSLLSEQINAELKIYNDNGAHFEIIFTVNGSQYRSPLS